MSNPTPDEALGKVFENVTLIGRTNVDLEEIYQQMEYSIRQNHPQVWWQPENSFEVCIVGSGPSLKDTEDELVELVWNGAKLVTVNGAYQWCLDRHLKPHAQIVLDARPRTARFVRPEVPECRYYIASQCHADVWETVKDYKHVGIFHAIGTDEGKFEQILDGYYSPNHWCGVSGGTTVTTRAIGLLRMLGYLRFHIFGMDSCWMGGLNHVMNQPENTGDRRLKVTIAAVGRNEPGRTFECSEWHIKQTEDFFQFLKASGNNFMIDVRGDGMIAYMLQSTAEVQMQIEEEPK